MNKHANLSLILQLKACRTIPQSLSVDPKGQQCNNSSNSQLIDHNTSRHNNSKHPLMSFCNHCPT